MQKNQIIVLSDDDDLPRSGVPSRSTPAKAQPLALAQRRSGVNAPSTLTNKTEPKSTSEKKTHAFYRSKILSGKTFAFRGVWLTMGIDAAEDLCKANGGIVTSAITSRTQYVVVGGKGSNLPISNFTEHGSQILSERDFINMILSPENSNVSKDVISGLSNGKKRAAAPDENGDESIGSSRPVKARKSDTGSRESLPDAKWVHDFLTLDRGEIQIRGMTLHAYDCGGEVFKAQRGKGVVDLIMKFEKYLEERKGELH